jgi:hypothetical protein
MYSIPKCWTVVVRCACYLPTLLVANVSLDKDSGSASFANQFLGSRYRIDILGLPRMFDEIHIVEAISMRYLEPRN